MPDDTAQGRAEAPGFALDPRLPIVAGVAMFALAVLSMSKAPAMGDAAELIIALAVAGIPHPTGYPLYVLAGHLFVRALHAIGISWVIAANAWSAAGAAVAMAGFARCVQHLVAAAVEDRSAPPTRSAIAVAVTAPLVVLAVNPVWIETSSQTEVYSWSAATLFMAAAFALGRLRSLESATETERRGSADRRTAFLWGLLCGTCLTFHLTSAPMLLTLSAALVAAHVHRRRWRASDPAIAIGAAFLPLASFGWITWRAAHPGPFQWPVEPTLASWWLHVRGAVYSHFLGRFAPSASDWRLIRAALLPFILPGLILGPLLALRAPSLTLRWGLMALLGGAALQIAFVVFYAVPDPSPYFLPSLMASLLVGAPVALWLARRFSTAAALSALFALVLVFATWSFVRVRATHTLLDRVDMGFRNAWAKVPFDRGIVLWADDHYHRFVMLQVLEGQRPGLYVDDPEMLVWPARRRAFIGRFGFDPLGDHPIRTQADLDRIPEIIRAKARQPVLILPQ